MQPDDTIDRESGLRLLHLTDPHLFADPAAQLHSVTTTESLRRVLRQALAASPRAPDAILVTGDIGDDGTEVAYARFRSLLQSAGVPVCCIAGNHDAPATMARLLDDSGFQFGGRRRLGAWELILLDSHVPDAPFGQVADGALAALERDLGSLADRPVLVAVHHPPMPVGSAWLDDIGLRNGAALLDLLARFPNVRVVVSGHVHQHFEAGRGQIRLFTTPSTCVQFAPRSADFALDDKPPGGRWLQLWPDGRCESELLWLDRA